MRILFAAAAAISLAGPAAAGPYSAMYVFGDSLSDRGNLAETGVLQALAGQPPTNYPNPPSFHDSFTNGDVAVQKLASSLGLSADPSLWVTGFQDIHGLFGPGFVPGTNYAVAGATAALQAVGGSPLINLPQQVTAYLSLGLADPNALYTVFIGGNDVRNAALEGTGLIAVAEGVATEIGAIKALTAAGARNFLVVNVPDVGAIPEFTQDHAALDAAATALSLAYDGQLAAGLSLLALPAGSKLYSFDLLSFDSEIRANGPQFGLTNTTDRCFLATPLFPAANPACGVNGANVNHFAYWDAIHPTAPVHALWAEGFEQALAGVEDPSPVPEPATLGLMAAGLLGLAFARRLRQPAMPALDA